MALTAQDQMYKAAVQDRELCGANIWRLRYEMTELTIKPNIEPDGQREQGSRSEPIGIFFKTYTAWIGKFAIKDQSLPKVAFQTGATWQMKVDDGLFSGESWQDVFILSEPLNTGLWYQLKFAEFVSSANLTVNYAIPTGTYTIIDGNSVPDTTSDSFTAIVAQQQKGELVEADGLPAVSRLYLEGYMSSPKTTALEANTGKLLPATLTNPTGTLEGEFIIVASAQPPQTGASAGSGELIKGFFLLTGDDRA